MTNWYVYILECCDGTFYTGITTNTERRLNEHNTGRQGAKYTRARRPVKLVFQQQCENRSDASKKEYRIRKLGRDDKKSLIARQSRLQHD